MRVDANMTRVAMQVAIEYGYGDVNSVQFS